MEEGIYEIKCDTKSMQRFFNEFRINFAAFFSLDEKTATFIVHKRNDGTFSPGQNPFLVYDIPLSEYKEDYYFGGEANMKKLRKKNNLRIVKIAGLEKVFGEDIRKN